MRRTGYGLDYLLLCLILCVSTYFLIGDFDVRLANTSSDEGPVAAAYVYKYPENFRNDPYSRNWVFYSFASLMSWLPALLFKHMDVPPEIPALFFVYLQNVLLGFAVFRFSLAATDRRDVAWLGTLFVFCYRPYCWNLAGYGDLMWMPYAGHLALPFLIYAAAFILENKLSRTMICLLIGGLFHPALGVMAAAITGCYWLRQHFKDPGNGLFWRLFLLVLVVGISIIPSQISLLHVERVIDDRFIAQFFGNSHAAPWKKNLPSYYYSFVKNLIIISIVSGFAAFSLRNDAFNNQVRSFWRTSLTASVILCLLHVMADRFQVMSIFQLLLTRSTLLVVIFSIPLIILTLSDRFKTGGFMDRLIIASLFIQGPSYLLMLSAFLGSISEGRLDFSGPGHRDTGRLIIRFLGYSMFAATLFMGVFPWEYAGIKRIDIPYNDLNPDLKLIMLSFLIAVFGSAGISKWLANIGSRFCTSVRKFVPKQAVLHQPLSGDANYFPGAFSIIPLLLVQFLLKNNYIAGRSATTGEFRAYYKVQLWARDNTGADAVFIVADSPVWFGWRNFSHRPFLFPYAFMPYYFLSEDINSYNRAVLVFYSGHYGRKVEFDETAGLFRGLDEAGLLAFSDRFKTHYLVKKTVTNNGLQLPVAYRNGYYTVFIL